MPAITKPIMAAALAAMLCIAPAAQAEDHTDPAQVLATVDGTDITLGHVIALRAGLPREYDQFPAALLFQGILDQLIHQTLLMQSLEGEVAFGNKVQIENERRAIIAGQVIGMLSEEGVDEADLMAAYEEQYPDNSDEKEYRASHILVDTEEEASALLTELEGSAEFADLAREHSNGPSSTVGGDLGWFGAGDMVDEFFDAVVTLAPGEVSVPVETQFGWHLVMLAETRTKARSEFDTVRNELENQLRQSVLDTHVEMLEAQATINRADTSDFDVEVINDFSILEN